MYRPQVPYLTPPQYEDHDFVHYFDQLNTNLLNSALSLAAGGSILGIPLILQSDAPFFWRGVKINGPSNFAVRFRDPYWNYMSDDFVPLPLDYSPREPAAVGSNPLVLEDIRCPAGSVILVDVKRIS